MNPFREIVLVAFCGEGTDVDLKMSVFLLRQGLYQKNELKKPGDRR